MANTTNLDLVKPLGTDHALISVINSNMDKIDANAGSVAGSLDAVRDGLAIVSNGDTHIAITAGQFVYVKAHNTLPEGLYVAQSNIAANGALSTSNLTADSKGGLNALSDQMVKVKELSTSVTVESYSYAFGGYKGSKLISDMTGYDASLTSRTIAYVPVACYFSSNSNVLGIASMHFDNSSVLVNASIEGSYAVKVLQFYK